MDRLNSCTRTFARTITSGNWVSDTYSFPRALKPAAQDPNVILVGEMRDLETIAAP